MADTCIKHESKILKLINLRQWACHLLSDQCMTLTYGSVCAYVYFMRALEAPMELNQPFPLSDRFVT